MRILSSGEDKYITIHRVKATEVSRMAHLIFDFPDLCSLIGGAVQLKKRAFFIENSRLYRIGKKYRLIIEFSASAPKTFLGIREYADGIFCSSVKVAATEEYGRLLLSSGAVEALKGLE